MSALDGVVGWYPDLAWADVDPRRHPFDPTSTSEVVRAAVLASRAALAEPPWHCCHTRDVAYGLAQHYGDWAGGWSWAMRLEPHSGTTIQHVAVPLEDVRGLKKKTEFFTDVLLQWRAWLEQCAELFSGLSDAPSREHGVAPVVSLVAHQTGTGECWLGELSQVLAWYLEFTGLPTQRAEDVADTLVYEHVPEWSAPSGEAVSRLARAIQARAV
ncbi:hypothetical protein [Streptomyces sp. NBC_00467]|uniref:hypothetical protein n=1 Tax=Streptomyces sp. NBC_00467 TaxID=2975752 RepID=UPI002E19BDF0